MNKQDILKVLEQSNSVSSNLTDNQISKYNSYEHKKNMSKAGKKGGSTNRDSGHMSELGKLNGAINGKSKKSIAAAKRIGKEIGKYNLLKVTPEQKLKGAKIAGKKNVESGHWAKYIKLGTEASTKARIERAYNKKVEVLSYITTETFIAKDIQSICNKLEYVGDFWKKVLREKSLVEQIHKGYNQFNPSVYKKINLDN